MNVLHSRRTVGTSYGPYGLVLMITLLVSVASPLRGKDLFLLHADGPTANADYAVGQRDARPVPANSYKVAKTSNDGRWGRSVDLTATDTTCIFDAQGNINPLRGTVDFWFRITAHQENMYHPLFGWYRPPNQPGNKMRVSGMEVYYQNSVLTLGLHTPKSKGYSQAAPWKLNQWHHLELHWDCSAGAGQSIYNVFLDGQNVIQVTDGGTLSGEGGELHLGIWDYGWGHFLHGQIDELRITDQIEHPLAFKPPTAPYALAATLPYARQTYQLARHRLMKLRAEMKQLLAFSGAQGDADAARILRSGQQTSVTSEARLGALQSALKIQDPDIADLCRTADGIARELNTARVAIYRISAPARALAEAEDQRSLLFKDLNEQLAGEALILNGKQLFLDDYLIAEMQGARKVLNRPTKHPRNPLVVPDLPWEQHGFYSNGTVFYDRQERLFKAWIHLWKHTGEELAATQGFYAYLTSRNGIDWTKPVINAAEQNNRIVPPGGAAGFCGEGIMKDPRAENPAQRYKMIFNSHPADNPQDLQTGVAYSPDGISWTADPQNPVIPFGDTQSAPLWDARRRAYLAFVRTGPPNVRGIARVESHDFRHWSPKITIFPPGGTKLDAPFRTVPYGMKAMAYAGNFIGLLNMYHWETLGPIPEDKLWQDKVNVQLAFSRNGVSWNRVGPQGVIPHSALSVDRDWQTFAENQVFLQYGKHQQEWDWGQIYSYHAPVVFDDKIWIYYTGLGSRHWSNYHGDERPPKSGMGLATLRLDGFVSVEAAGSGSLLTKPFIALGDTLVVNADAAQGEIRVEAIDALGRVIKGFSEAECQPITTDQVRHVVTWKQGANCHPLQGRPIQLRFHLKQAKLYSLEFQIRHKHYVPISFSQ